MNEDYCNSGKNKYRDLEAAPSFSSSIEITIDLKVESNTAPLCSITWCFSTAAHPNPTFPLLTLQHTSWQSPQARNHGSFPDADFILVLHNARILYPSFSSLSLSILPSYLPPSSCPAHTTHLLLTVPPLALPSMLLPPGQPTKGAAAVLRSTSWENTGWQQDLQGRGAQ